MIVTNGVLIRMYGLLYILLISLTYNGTPENPGHGFRNFGNYFLAQRDK